MSRVGVFIPCISQAVAAELRIGMVERREYRGVRIIRLRDKAKRSDTDRMADVVLAMVSDYQAWKDGVKGDKPAEPEKCERCGGAEEWDP